MNIPPLRSRVSGEWEPPFRWVRASVPGNESRYLFRYSCASSPHELSMAAGDVVHDRHAAFFFLQVVYFLFSAVAWFFQALQCAFVLTNI